MAEDNLKVCKVTQLLPTWQLSSYNELLSVGTIAAGMPNGRDKYIIFFYFIVDLDGNLETFKRLKCRFTEENK